jgi:protein-disulfide isomerase
MAAGPGGLNRFYLMLGVALVAGGGVMAYVLTRKQAVSIPANPMISVSDTSGFSGYYLGSDSAALTVTEYADYECPACQQWAMVQFPSIRERLITTGRVRWRYRDFPLDMHRHSRVAAHAAACANEQGKYWEMNGLIYSWGEDWPLKRDASGVFRDFAKKAGADLTAYDACMASGRYAGRIAAGRIEGTAVGVTSTPTFLVNGRLYPGGGSIHYDMLKAMLDSLAGRPAS